MLFFDPPEDLALADLRQVAAKAAVAAKEFFRFVDRFDLLTERKRRLKELCAEGEAAARDALRRLRLSGVAPIRPESLEVLFNTFADISASFEIAASRTLLHKAEFATLDSRILASALERMTTSLASGISDLRNPKVRSRVLEALRAIQREAREAERIEVQASASLIHAKKDALTILAWKDVYEVLVHGARLCRDAARVIEGVLISQC